MRFVKFALATCLVAPFIFIMGSPANAAEPPVETALLGTSAANAAGSCWEIKQAQPGAQDGSYWLLTPMMTAPQQFYCDQTTDGGGWVLIGKGRNGWTKNYVGKGSASALSTPDVTPMSSVTTQLPSADVDALLNGTKVNELDGGIRLRRALNADGTSWQEARLRLSKPNGWVWAFGATNPLTSWSFDATTGTGGNTQNFGSGNDKTRIDWRPKSEQSFSQGWAYGSSARGTTDATSFLWSASASAGFPIPYTQVFIRPQVLSTDSGFTQISNSGVEGWSQQSVADSLALNSPWEVTGIAGSASKEGTVEVQAFAESNGVMYVGGNFARVRNISTGEVVEQPYLAAFNLNSGELIRGFRPTLNEQVKALAALPNGSIVAGGEFSQANGVARTLPAFKADGTLDTSFNLTSEDRRSSGVNRIETLKVIGDYVYVGGSFTHMLGGPNMRQASTMFAGRALVSTGLTSTDWNPNLNGNVIELAPHPSGDRVLAVGFFSAAGGSPSLSAGVLSTDSGAALVSDGWAPVWSSTGKYYQQAAAYAGGRAWIGGSEHSLFQYDENSYERTFGNIMNDKGDLQAIDTQPNGVLYAGCHCNYYDYSDAYFWPSVGSAWSIGHGMNWVGAWDVASGQRMAQFSPNFSMRLGSGIWAIQNDSNDVLWVGGDITRVATSSSQGRNSGGFARFALNDSTAPNTPGNFRINNQNSTSVTLAWNAVSGANRYQVLRNDRPIWSGTATSVNVPKRGDARYFVRAVDAAGNYSATTSVLAATPAPATPVARFAITSTKWSTLGFDATSSEGGTSAITSYVWDFGDGTSGTGSVVSHAYEAAGNYTVTLTIQNEAGAQASTSIPVVAGTPPNPAPADAFGQRVWAQEPWLYYRLSDATPLSVAIDAGPDRRNGTYRNVTGWSNTTGALTGVSDTAKASTGSAGFVASPAYGQGPNDFSVGVWFRTTSTQGGRLIGFGTSATTTSGSYDRHLQVLNTGQIMFGVYPGAERRVTSPAAYRDGQWHQAFATLSSTAGMKLYVDGQLVASDPSTTSAEGYSGLWKVGGDNVWSGTTSRYLSGAIDEAVVYTRPLPAVEVAAQYALAKGQTPPTAPPTATFESTLDGRTASFDASSSFDEDGSIVSYVWDFGDGTSGTGVQVQHTYAPGTYTAKLTVTDNDGATGVYSRSITVIAFAPTAAFESSQDGRTLSFDASGSADADGSIVSYVWDFGDGTSGSGVEAEHTYAPGTYTVKLTVTDNEGLIGETTRDVTVVNLAPVAAFDATVDRRDVSFDASGSSDPDGTVASYDWDFGDGTSGSGVEAEHTYAPGTYTVKLTVTDNEGRTGETSQQVTVLAPQAPNADFDATVNGRDVSFDASDSADDGSIVSYVWDFGDGTSGSGVEAEHTYAPGTYTVKLTVTDNEGLIGETTRDVTVVNLAPVAAFDATVDRRDVSFDASGSSDPDGTVASYDWDFGDGTSGSGVEAEHTYAPGTYTVKLTVTDNEGRTGETSQQVTVVNAAPKAEFDSSVDGLTASFDASASSDADGTVASYAWDFGDGATASGVEAEVEHDYAEGGVYPVKLTVTDNDGRTDEITQNVSVGSLEPVTETVIGDADSWRWRYEQDAPPSNWNARTFDSSGWSLGGAVLGWGHASVVTNISTAFPNTADRPRAAYFTKSFEVSDASKVTQLVLDTVADDGAVVYVNGTEVARQNMPAGAITHMTFAPSARRAAVAEAQGFVIDVPVGLLVNGTNVVAVESHVNYRATPDLTFHLNAELTRVPASSAPVPEFGFTADGLSVNFDASSSSGGNTPITGYTWNFGDGATASGVAPQHTYDEAGTYPVTLEVTNGAGRTAELTQTVTVAESTEPVTETVIGDADSWRWRYEQDAPPSNWNARTFDSSGWSLGGAVLGWGHASVVTNISTAFPNTADRPRAAYFTKSFEVADASKVTQLVLDTVADDGAVVYVNGTEVARQNMPAGAITHMTFAPSARRAAVAEAQGFVIDVPVGLLVNGTNVVAVESHVNYRATPDLTFHLNADLTRTP